MADLARLVAGSEVSPAERRIFFQHLLRRIAGYRNTVFLYVSAEVALSSSSNSEAIIQQSFESEVDHWANELIKNAWTACGEPLEGSCPILDEYSDTSTKDLKPLPPPEHLAKLVNTILFIHITATKQYSARTRFFLAKLAPLDETTIALTLKNPDHALQEIEKHTKSATHDAAEKSKLWRNVGIGVSAAAGGILVGVTGGLAAPLVGAGVTTILGWLGVGGTAAGVLASGLAGSSVVCGSLFGAYGARSSARMMERHTREIRDFALVPVRPPRETLAVTLCVSGWLSEEGDVTAPWTVLDGDDVVALKWEVEALRALSTALGTLMKAHAIKYLQVQIIKRTIFASLMSSLSPIAWLKIGQIIDNPWMNAKARALKAGRVLGTLLANRVMGNRPLTLTGYSLGSLVLLEALKHLASLPASQTAHLIQDAYLFGTPASADDTHLWASARRVVAGRLVNGYVSARDDYILAILSRTSDAIGGVGKGEGRWGVAGLQPVEVRGVENVECVGVKGHLQWRGMIGRCLQQCGVPGVVDERVEAQVRDVASRIEKEMEMDEEEVDAIAAEEPSEVEAKTN